MEMVLDRKVSKAVSIIMNLMEKHGIKQVDLRNATGYSKSFFHNLLNESKHCKFPMVLNVVRTIDNMAGISKEKTIMLEYIDTLTKPEYLVDAMDYCDRNNYLKALRTLTERALSYKKNPQLQEWGVLFNINLQRKEEFNRITKLKNNAINGNIIDESKYIELRNEVIKFNTTTNGTYIYKQLVLANIYDNMACFNDVYNTLAGVENYITSDIEAFSSESYYYRIHEMMQSYFSRNQCNFDEAEKHSDILINSNFSLKFIASGCIIMGESNMFRDPQKAIYNFEKAIEIYKQIGMDDVAILMHGKIEVTRIYWGIEVAPDTIYHQQNKAYWLIKQNRNEEALEILDLLNAKNNSEAFHKYLLGLATGDIMYLYMSLEIYIKRNGNRLFAMLPRDALLSAGQNEYAVNAIYYQEIYQEVKRTNEKN
ncbi:AimR family lysis-lysogeny pheromone receptor [Cytobacillus sp. IB215665]|uniref:AimR family lysis-lysogeny pheromone receptor n=1 Tax=Cytobacillus sp. IB215665 TaxID=3097357 RepID=UPI002A0DF8C7|nr:AimR family lysis-lysogeny pheromone receptor [Cytobacillus sp. IB215665]MDX8367167.1 AimR family lysis-lysogeny pheromone receptor [Cytobacillus sp. IB215665]